MNQRHADYDERSVRFRVRTEVDLDVAIVIEIPAAFIDGRRIAWIDIRAVRFPKTHLNIVKLVYIQFIFQRRIKNADLCHDALAGHKRGVEIIAFDLVEAFLLEFLSARQCECGGLGAPDHYAVKCHVVGS